MSYFFKSKSAKEYIETLYNFDTLFNKKPRNIVEKIKRFIFLFFINTTEYLINKKLFIENHVEDTLSKETQNTIHILRQEGILGEVWVFKIDNYNLYSVGLTFKTIKMLGAAGGGVSTTKKEALQKALGELIERYDSLFTDNKSPKFLRKRFEEVKERAINPKKFDYFNLYNSQTAILWHEGFNFFTGTKKLLPANLCYMDFSKRRLFQNEPFFYHTSTNGVAIQQTFNRATQGAIYELIERDAFLCHWLLKITPNRINLDTLRKDSQFKFYLDKIERSGGKLYLLDITTDLEIPTIASVLITAEEQLFVSASCGVDIAKLILKNIKDMVAFSFHPAEKNKQKVEKIITLTDIMPYWQNRGDIEKHMQFLLCGEEIHYTHLLHRHNTVPLTMEGLKTKLKEKNIEIYLVNLTSNTSKYFGLHTIRAVSPNLMQIYFGDKYKYTKHPRIESFARIKNLKNYTINQDHPPFT